MIFLHFVSLSIIMRDKNLFQSPRHSSSIFEEYERRDINCIIGMLLECLRPFCFLAFVQFMMKNFFYYTRCVVRTDTGRILDDDGDGDAKQRDKTAKVKRARKQVRKISFPLNDEEGRAVAVKGCFSPFAVARCIAGQSSWRNAAWSLEAHSRAWLRLASFFSCPVAITRLLLRRFVR